MCNLNILFYRQLEEIYFNQYTENKVEVNEVDGIEEGLENCDNGSEEVVDEELYCVACNKFFNSESAKLNHEASKKHKQNIGHLKSEMMAEEKTYQEKLTSDIKKDVDLDIDHDNVNNSEEDESEVETAKKSKGKKSKKKNKKVINYEISEPEPEPEPELVANDKENLTIESKAVESDEEDWSNSKKAKKTKAKGKPKSEKSKPSELEPKEVVIVRELTQELDDSTESSEHHCATCKATFQSKNKLFTHLKKTNHSIYLGDKAKVSGEKPSSRKKK